MSTVGTGWNSIIPPNSGNGSYVLTSTGTNFAWQDPGVYTTRAEIEIGRRLDKIEKQLLILKPSIELHEKYPALKEAYEAYLLVLKMVEGPGSENNGV